MSEIEKDFSDWFSKEIIRFAEEYGRFDLPWKNPATPYRVWLSEIMLQQTQVQTVMGYFDRFMHRFPDIERLGKSSLDEVLSLWAGLGYYRRAHYLHETAKKILHEFDGCFPNDLEALMSLPGIGRSTAGAILAQGFDISAPILDGNVKRVLCRFFAIPGYPDSPATLKKLWPLAEKLTPKEGVGTYTQGMMDLGATLCTKKDPLCHRCPIQAHCLAFKTQTQAKFPEPKPQKPKPTKRCLFALIFNDQNQLLLVKRPNEGIWSGLWSLPALPYLQNKQDIREHLDFVEIVEIKPKGKHAFTHFHLEYKPVILRALSAFRYKEREQVWISEHELSNFGLPAPIKKTLKEHGFGNDENGLLS